MGQREYKILKKGHRTPYYSILTFLLCIISMGGSKRVGVTTNEKRHKKVVPMYQAPLCEFQGEFKFGIEEKQRR